jgi:hypothetical protein
MKRWYVTNAQLVMVMAVKGNIFLKVRKFTLSTLKVGSKLLAREMQYQIAVHLEADK